MDPLAAFCPNQDCVARGHTQRGNIKIHCRRRRRYRCTECGKTFSERAGTPFLYAHTPTETIIQVLVLIAHGCPIAAIEAAFGFQRRTVRDWIEKAGTHCQAVHQALVLQPHVLHQVQCDEIFVRTQRGWRYLFSALCVSTRLWVGGLISAKRDEGAARKLAQMVHRAAFLGPLLIVTDGLRCYGKAFLHVFRTPERTGRGGRPRLRVWSGLVLVQHVKRQRVVRLVLGSWTLFAKLWHRVGTAVVSTSYIERLNATFRERLSVLARRSRHLARQQQTLEGLLYLLGSMYNFCWVHRSLGRTPAMAAGLVEQVWSGADLLWYRVPPDRWRPRVHRGPLSKHERKLLAQWGT